MRQKLLAILFALIVSLIFFYPVLSGKIPFPGDNLVGRYEPYKSYSYDGYSPGGVVNKAQGPDVIRELIPWKKFSVESFKKFQIPLWDPYNFSGNPLMADFQSGVFYPFNLVFFLLPFYSAWTLLILLTPVLSLLFSYIFLKRLKLTNPACLLGAISFAFCSYMVNWMEYGNVGHTFLWLPLALYFTDLFIEKLNPRVFIGLIMCLFVSLLAGYIQGAFYIYVVIATYFFLKSYSDKKLNSRKTIFFVSALFFPLILSAFQILPTLELFAASSRGNYSMAQIQKMLNPVYYLITVIVPDFFGNPASRNYWYNGTYIEQASYFGLIPFVLAIFAVVSLIKKVEVKIFSILFFASIILATDIFVTRFFYLIPIPVISTTVVTRILSIFSFSGSVLAAYGFNEVLQRRSLGKFMRVLVPILILLLGIFMLTILAPKIFNSQDLISGFSIAKRNLIIPIVTLLFFSALCIYYFKEKVLYFKFKKEIFIVLVLLIVVADLFYYFQKITPFSSISYAYPTTPVVSYLSKNAGINRFWGYGEGYIESNFQTYDSTFSTDGYDPIHIKRYTEFLAASKDGKIPQSLPRPDANIFPGFGTSELRENNFRQKVLDVTGVKYVLIKNEALNRNLSPDYLTFPQDKYKLVWQDAPWQIYENKEALPRVFLASDYIVESDNQKILSDIFSSKFDLKNTLILEQSLKGFKPSSGSSNVKIVSYEPNKIVLETNSNSDKLLFVSDTYFQGWKATIDGSAVQILRADYAFRAVPVNAGQHTVIMEYSPRSFSIGLLASFAALILLSLFVTITKKNGNFK